MKIAIALISLSILLLNCTQVSDINAYLKELHEDGELNGNVLVIQNDIVRYERSFGYADGARKHLLTAEHRFAIGSIYKEFPAVAIMQLKEEGLLTLEDRLSSFMPHLPRWADKITIKNLLQYSSGLPKINWESYFEKGTKIDVEKVVQDLSALEALAFEPGTDYLYSNYNPFLLIKIVEALTKMEFGEYVKQKILLPFELDGIVIKKKYPFEDTTLMALPFDDAFKEDDYRSDIINICSSATGMYQWFSQLDDFEIVTKASMQQLSEEAIQGNNIQAPLGRCDWEGEDIELRLHHGSNVSYECLVRNHKQDGLIIVLLTNQKHSNLHDIADTIYDYYKEK